MRPQPQLDHNHTAVECCTKTKAMGQSIETSCWQTHIPVTCGREKITCPVFDKLPDIRGGCQDSSKTCCDAAMQEEIATSTPAFARLPREGKPTLGKLQELHLSTNCAETHIRIIPFPPAGFSSLLHHKTSKCHGCNLLEGISCHFSKASQMWPWSFNILLSIVLCL